jgi:hypothetical protein
MLLTTNAAAWIIHHGLAVSEAVPAETGLYGDPYPGSMMAVQTVVVEEVRGSIKTIVATLLVGTF